LLVVLVLYRIAADSQKEHGMAILEFQTQIDALPGRIFAYISDLEKHVEWSGGQVITKTSEGPLAAGSTYETQEEGPFGMILKENVDVLQYHPSERFAWRSYGPMGTWFDWSCELRPQNGGTILVERLDRSKGLLATVMLKLIIQRQMRKAMPEGLTKIKEQLQGN
jgi:hypothetical protein